MLDETDTRTTTEIDRTPAPVDDLPHIVIVGAGFAGLNLAKALCRARVRVTVIDRRNYHLFVPLLYQVATAALSPADIAEPVRKVLRRCTNTDVVLGEVVGVDTGRRQVRLADGSFVPYDRLILATGSSYGYFGHDEWADIAPGLKTVEDARQIRSRLLMCFEQAEMAPDAEQRRRLMTTVIVGGGPTGVELAGSIAELARHTLVRDFRRIRPDEARVLLVEAGPRLLPAFPETLADYAKRALERLGVTVELGRPVEAVTETGVTIGGEFVPAGTILWGAGVQASPAARWIGAEADRAGRIRVEPDLSVPGHPEIFVLGDTALVTDENGKPLPGLAQVAKQQGHHLGRALAANFQDGTPIPPFRFKNRGNTAIVGRHAAVFDFGRWQLKGWLAWLLWAIVHVWLLVGFEKRVLVTAQWLWRYVTYQRGARLITTEARVPLAETAPSPLGADAVPLPSGGRRLNR